MPRNQVGLTQRLFACRVADAPRRRRKAQVPLLATEKIIALGVSTGGTGGARRSVAHCRQRTVLGGIINQHSSRFAERLGFDPALQASAKRDGETRHRSVNTPGRCHHMEVQRPQPTYVVRNSPGGSPSPPWQ